LYFTISRASSPSSVPDTTPMRMTTGAEACPSRSMMEALCRFRLGKIFTRTETRNYYRACKEYQACLELLQSVDMSPVRATQFSAAHTALAELYEMFDEYDKAQTHYAEANKYDAVASLGELIMSAAMPEDDAVCDDGSGYFLSDESDEEDDTPEA